MKFSLLFALLCLSLVACTTQEQALTIPGPTINSFSVLGTTTTSTPAPTPKIAIRTPANTPEPQIAPDDQIKHYLETKLGISSSNGKVFAAYETLGKLEKEGMNDVFIWALVQEYSKGGSEMKKGNGTNKPLSLIMMDQGDGIPVVTEHSEDTSSFPEDIRANKIFDATQEEYRKQIIKKLESEVESQARKYFVAL